MRPKNFTKKTSRKEKRRPTRYIIDNYCNRRISDVAWNEAPKSLLPCSVPVEYEIQNVKHYQHVSSI